MEIGTLTLTENSPIVTGSGTAFATTLASGYALVIGGLTHLIASIESATSLTLSQPWDGETMTGVAFERIVTSTHVAELHENVEDLIRSFGPMRVGADKLNEVIDELSVEIRGARDEVVAANDAVQDARSVSGENADEAIAAKVAAESARDTSIQKNALTVTLANQVDASAKAVKASETAVVNLEASTRANAVASDDSAGKAKTSEINAGGFAADARADKLATDQNVATTTADRQAVAEMKAGVDQARTETISARDTTISNRQTVETLAARVDQDKLATAEYAAAAEAAADRADSFDPSSLARLDGANFTGPVSVSGAPVWHSGNFNPSNYATAANASIQNVATISGNAPRITFNETDVGKVWYGVADGSNFSIREDTTSSANIKFNITAGAKALNLGTTSMTWGGSVVYTTDNLDTGRLVQGDNANRTTSISGQDMMAARPSGFYNGYQLTNAPDTNAGRYWHMLNMRHQNTGNHFAAQIAVAHDAPGLMYLRSIQDNAAPDGWRQIWNDANFNPATKANLTGATFTGAVSVPSDLTVRAQNADMEGGQIVLKKAPNQGIDGDMIIDTQGNSFRVFDSITTGRMLAYNAYTGSLSINGQTVYHSGNLDLSKYVRNDGQQTLTGLTTITGGGLAGGLRMLNPTAKRDWRMLARDDGSLQISDETAGSSRMTIGSDGWITAPVGFTVGADQVTLGRSYQRGLVYATSGGSQLVLKNGTDGNNRSVIHRNDGAAYYILVSDPQTYATDVFNALRPLSINLTNGGLTSNNGQVFSGGTTVNGGLDVAGNGPVVRLNNTGTADMVYEYRRNGVIRWNHGDSQTNNLWYLNKFSATGAYATTPISVRYSDDMVVLNGSITVSNGGATGGGIVLSDDGDIVDLNTGYAAMRFSSGVQIYSGNKGGSPAITLGSNGSITANSSSTASEVYTNNWLRCKGDGGVYWEARGRGIQVADAQVGYGNITIYGGGANNWPGYSIGTWSTFMANGSDTGLYSQARGLWQMRFDNNNDCWFPANVVAYSDERLKENMRPIDDVAGRRRGLAKAAIVYERDGRTRIGFGAQTLRKTSPEFVLEASDLPKTLSVAYAETTAVLAVDLDHQATRIDALEAENTALRDRLSNIENLMLKEGK